MLSKKAKYALKALTVLTENYGQGPILISQLAERERIPRKFLELILLQLKNNGILMSKKGKGGGYLLSRSPEKVNLGQIIRIVDGPLAPLPCVSRTAYVKCDECHDEKTCNIRIIMKEVRDSTAAILEGTTLDEFAHVSRRSGKLRKNSMI